MSAENDAKPVHEGGDGVDGDADESTYQPPPQKTIEEILAADQEDESLRKYKEALLGAAQTETIVVGRADCILMVYEHVDRKHIVVTQQSRTIRAR